jgi:hypothetical protein
MSIPRIQVARFICDCSLFLWLYSPLLGLGRYSVSWSYTQTAGLLGRLINPFQGLYLNTGQHKQRINTYTHTHTKHSCLEWDSNHDHSVRAREDSSHYSGLKVITTEETEQQEGKWRRSQTSQAQSMEERKGDTVRLFGMNSLKKGAVWCIYAMQALRHRNTLPRLRNSRRSGVFSVPSRAEPSRAEPRRAEPSRVAQL